jgi:hypothetical protein
VYAVTGPLSSRRQSVHRVSLVDRDGGPVTLKGLAGSERADPRFFNFPDGTAGVLLERTGMFYRLKELTSGADNRASTPILGGCCMLAN